MLPGEQRSWEEAKSSRRDLQTRQLQPQPQQLRVWTWPRGQAGQQIAAVLLPAQAQG
jgi:hypothetical protein